MLPERLTGVELLTYFGLLRGLPESIVRDRTRELLQVLDLADAVDTLVIEYSSGMRKKIGLAAAILHAPELLVLDEPFESIDPVSSMTIRNILRRFVEAGNTVVFSSHVMPLVELLCSHVAIMADGRVRIAGTLDEVRKGRPLEDVFVDLVGAEIGGREGLAWLAS
jgi:ABC-2 type transport system ATP-binding protein